MKYVVNAMEIKIDGYTLKNEDIVKSIHDSNKVMKEIYQMTQKFDIPIFELLGMRNLSGFVGECFAKSLSIHSNDNLTSNMHQDGYPDLLLIDTKEKKDYLKSLYITKNGKKYPVSKEAFSPFKYGGIEVKATCGITPKSSSTYSKPLIGEKRINQLEKFDWKAHHRKTNQLLAVLWDFKDGIPIIAACFYCSDLEMEDWGKIVQPKEGGGRTTSISIMRTSGIRKMCNGWIAVLDEEDYIKTLSQKKWIGNELLEKKDAC